MAKLWPFLLIGGLAAAFFWASRRVGRADPDAQEGDSVGLSDRGYDPAPHVSGDGHGGGGD